MMHFTNSLTVFRSDGSLDEQGLRAHFDRLANSGTGVYVGSSGAGEALTMNSGELRTVLEIAAESVRGRVPLRLNAAEPRSADEMRRLITLAAEVGLDAVQVPQLDVGHGYRTSVEEDRDYYRSVLGDAGIPVSLMLNSVAAGPIRTDLVDGLLSEGYEIVGITAVTRSMREFGELVDAVGGRAEVHIGGATAFTTALTLGATGYMTVEGNLIPAHAMATLERFTSGTATEFATAASASVRLAGLNAVFPSVVGIKAALRALGLPGGWPRPPRRSPAVDAINRFVEGIRALAFAELSCAST
jgi:dihydrodipicolinate synthase/N-acetylneuraminate lyase